MIKVGSRDEAIDRAKQARFLIGSNEVRQIVELGPNPTRRSPTPHIRLKH